MLTKDLLKAVLDTAPRQHIVQKFHCCEKRTQRKLITTGLRFGGRRHKIKGKSGEHGTRGGSIKIPGGGKGLKHPKGPHN